MGGTGGILKVPFKGSCVYIGAHSHAYAYVLIFK